ncbi:unnamed protein product [Paramecium pentaurelia]|uniref:Uncharacterized protein n=1 Tax=Paramecium pentaurelia TaxID=43138 RepID=A0A8S1XSA3_9CILI|nr:unnamed protein product [Paramecium pentaurelia]
MRKLNDLGSFLCLSKYYDSPQSECLSIYHNNFWLAALISQIVQNLLKHFLQTGSKGFQFQKKFMWS